MRTKEALDAGGIESTLVKVIEKLLDQGETFDSLTVSLLAERAGIARSSFYGHFANKTELISRLIQHVAAEISEAAGVWFSNPEAATRADIAAAVEGIAAVYERHRSILQAVVEMSASNPVVATIYRRMIRGLVSRNRSVVLRASRAGRTRPNLHLEVGDALMWMVERCCYQLHAVDDAGQRRRLIEGMGFVVWHSLFRDAEPATPR